MKGLESAEWVMNRLHGFILYGSKLTVKRARNNFEWDRKRFSGSLPHIPGTMGNSVGTSLGHGEGLEASRLRRKILEVSEKSDESTGVSIPSAEKRLEVESVDRSRPGTEAEVLQSLWAERNCINDDSREMEAFRGKVNFLELMGGECNDLSGVNGVERGMGEIRVWNGGIEGNGVAEEANINPTHEQLGGELGRELTKVQGPDFELISDVLHHSGPQGIRVEVGPAACSMGPLGIEDYLGGADVIPSHNQKLSWVDIVSGKENSGLLVSKDLVDGKITEHGSDRGFIVDFDEDKIEDSVIHQNFILLEGCCMMGRLRCVVGNVYAPCNLHEQALLWGELRALKANKSLCWIIGGDFNAVRLRSEKSGCSFIESGCREFNNCIADCGLVDLPMCWDIIRKKQGAAE
ncbi:hypothetical protein V6N12_042427 [Hibiscus sabdariffa]|uniref:Uncharacterized protein n=1 Tax=Hibiscus sabdariffa TaxID=183260 RepID=A0ABR2EER5_9ROSI